MEQQDKKDIKKENIITDEAVTNSAKPPDDAEMENRHKKTFSSTNRIQLV